MSEIKLTKAEQVALTWLTQQQTDLNKRFVELQKEAAELSTKVNEITADAFRSRNLDPATVSEPFLSEDKTTITYKAVPKAVVEVNGEEVDLERAAKVAGIEKG